MEEEKNNLEKSFRIEMTAGAGKFLIRAFYLGLIANFVVVILMIIVYQRPELDIKVKCFYLSSVVSVIGNFLMISQLYLAGKNLIKVFTVAKD